MGQPYDRTHTSVRQKGPARCSLNSRSKIHNMIDCSRNRTRYGLGGKAKGWGPNVLLYSDFRLFRGLALMDVLYFTYTRRLDWLAGFNGNTGKRETQQNPDPNRSPVTYAFPSLLKSICMPVPFSLLLAQPRASTKSCQPKLP